MVKYSYPEISVYRLCILCSIPSLLAKILVEVDQGAGIVNVVEVKLFEDQDRHSNRPLAKDVFDIIAT